MPPLTLGLCDLRSSGLFVGAEFLFGLRVVEGPMHEKGLLLILVWNEVAIAREVRAQLWR